MSVPDFPDGVKQLQQYGFISLYGLHRILKCHQILQVGSKVSAEKVNRWVSLAAPVLE